MAGYSTSNKRIATNTLFLYMRMILVLVVSLYTTRVVLNALGVVDYGINNVVAGFVSMFAFLNTSMSNGIQRFYNYKLGEEGEESIITVYNTALLIQFIIAIIILILLETVGLWYLNEKMVIPGERMTAARWIYQFSVISLMFVILQIPFSAAIMAHEQMSYYAYVSIIDVVLKLGFALWLPHASSDKLIIYGIYSLGITVLNFILYYIYCKRKIKSIKFKLGFHKELFIDMMSFSGWNIFGTFAYMIKNQGVNVLLNSFFGPVVNAARGVSSTVGSAIQGFQSNVVISFRPQTVQSYAEGNVTRVKSLMYSLSKISYLMLYMLSMPVIIELPYILKIWLGDTIPDYTVSFTILMLIIMVLSALNTPLSQVVHATGRMKHYQIGTSIVVCSILPIAWLALRMGGDPNVVYYVSIFLTILNQAVCLFLLKNVFPYSIAEYLKEVILPCLVVTVMASIIPVVIHLVMRVSFIRLVIVGIVGVCGTVLLSYIFALNNYEKDMVNELTRKIIKR